MTAGKFPRCDQPRALREEKFKNLPTPRAPRPKAKKTQTRPARKRK